MFTSLQKPNDRDLSRTQHRATCSRVGECTMSGPKLSVCNVLRRRIRGVGGKEGVGGWEIETKIKCPLGTREILVRE